jgi:hypothetical protein
MAGATPDHQPVIDVAMKKFYMLGMLAEKNVCQFVKENVS